MEEQGTRHPWIERLREQRDRHLSRSRLYRIPFAVLGFTIVLVGIALLVLPGPGLLVMAVGFAMLALEFAWAERVLERTLDQMSKTSKTGRHARRNRPGVGMLIPLAALPAEPIARAGAGARRHVERRRSDDAAVDTDPALPDPFLGLAARAQPDTRKQFGDALRRCRCLAHPRATSTKARKIRRSASLISNSGCH